VPTGVAGVVWVREPDGKGPKTIAWHPSTCADELVEGAVQTRCGGGPLERLVPIAAEPDDGLRTFIGIVWFL
jgi:hypothetical protein